MLQGGGEVSTVWADFDLFPGGAAVGLIHGFNKSASAPEPGVYSLDLLRGSALRFVLNGRGEDDHSKSPNSVLALKQPVSVFSPPHRLSSSLGDEPPPLTSHLLINKTPKIRFPS